MICIKKYIKNLYQKWGSYMYFSLGDYLYSGPPKTRKTNRSYVFETPAGMKIYINHVTPSKWEMEGHLYRSKKEALNTFYRMWNMALDDIEGVFNDLHPDNDPHSPWGEAYHEASIHAYYPDVSDAVRNFVCALDDGDLSPAID